MKKAKKILSLILAIVMLVTTSSIAFLSYAVTDFTTGYDLQIYYYDEEKNFTEVSEQITVEEQKDIQLYAVLVYDDGTKWDITTSGMPLGMEEYRLDWTSDARYLAFCEKNDGKIHGYDATKGEAIRNWINNEVATTPVVGELLAKAILAALESGAYDIDDLDTEDVVKILGKVCDTVKVSEDVKEKLTSSVADYLNKYDVGISATLYDPDGKKIDSDTIRLLVLKASNLLSDVIPNAAFIKNYDSIPETCAVGYEMDLEGIITPVRTHYKCTWTVTGQYGVLPSNIATVDENGHFTAVGEGTIKVKVSPDINGLTEKLKNAFELLQKAGDLVDNESIAKAILLILGIKSDTDNYGTLVSIINRILDTTDGNVDFSNDNFNALANFILYVIYQDEVTIKVVSPDKIPVTSYDITGDTSITEGETSTFKFTNVKPDGAVPHNYKVSIDNEEYAVLTEDNGLTVLGIDGSTWNNNYVTPNKTNLHIDMEGLTKDTQLSIYGKNNKNVVYIKIGTDEYLPIDEIKSVDAVTYPKRLTPSLQYGWENEDGTYNFATSDEPAYTEDGFAYVTADGLMSATGCTVNNLVVKEANGAIAKKQIMSGIQTTGVKFSKKHFWLKANSGVISSGIRGSVCEMYAYILPKDASFNNITFTSSDTNSVILSANPLTTSQYTSAALTEERREKYASATVTCDENGMATVYAYAIGNDACSADITAKSQTGGFTDMATVAFANLSVTDVTIKSLEDSQYKQEDDSYLITAGDIINFSADVKLSDTTSLKNQGFEDVDWSVDNEELASLNQAGVFKGLDVGTVNVTATSVFGEISKSVSVRILPNYKELLAAIDNCDYDNLDPYDWSYASWDKFDALYKEANDKIKGNLFNSQKEVDSLAISLKEAFEGLVRYMPLEKLEISSEADSDGNGFASVDVGALSNYTNYSAKIDAIVYPEEAKDYKLEYTSSNPSAITVDENGVCRPVSSSDAAWTKITVKVTDPKNGNVFTKEMYVAFAKYQVTSVSVEPNNFTFVGVGDYAETNSTTITPSYKGSSTISPSIKDGFFVSSNEDVVKVTPNGVATPVGLGDAVITFYSYDGGYSAQTNVKVTTNKKALQSAIDRANALVEDFYTPESFANVQTALEKANSVNNETSTQEAINIAADELEDALSKLEKNPYANVTIANGNGGAVEYEGNIYTGENRVKVLIENGLTVSAKADSGYAFTKWVDANGNTISTNATETFTIDYNAYFKAEFTEVHAVTGVKIFVEDTDTDYFTKDVGTLATYTSQKVKISSQITPANANFYDVKYTMSNDELKLDNGTLSPRNNSVSYSFVTVTVTNTLTGEKFSDTVCVAFVKYVLESVSSNPTLLVFNGTNAVSQAMNINYNGSGSQTPSLRKGAFKSNDASIATVDNDGNVTPVGIGSTTIEFTSFDGGKKAYTTVNVYADKTALQSAIANANAVVRKNYTEESYNAMQEKLAVANTVNEKEFTMQNEVDIATSNLQEAINNLEKLDLMDYDIVIEGKGYVLYNDSSFDADSIISLKNGETVSLTATAKEHSEFVGWYDFDNNLVSNNTVYTFTVDGAAGIKAKFVDLVYVQSAEITVLGENTSAKHIDVGLVQNYSNVSAELGVIINPSNPSHYKVEYYLGNDCNNLKLDGSTLSPLSNDIAYGTVYVKVTDTVTNKEYVDSALVAFSKYYVTGVGASSSVVTFNGENSASQSVNITYSSSSSRNNASCRRGIIKVDDEKIATATTQIGDNGTYTVITPKSIGITTATFTAYDGGYSTNIVIYVYADKSALQSARDELAALNSEDYVEETFAAVQPIIDYADEIINKEFATQEEVDYATASLIEVKNSLVLRDVLKITASPTANGHVTINDEHVSSIKANRGDTVTLKATADKDYMLDGWYNGNTKVSSSVEYTFTAENAIDLIAKFVPIPYVSNVVLTYGDTDTFAQVGVSTIRNYTNYDASFGIKVYPENADYTVVGWRFGNKNQNLTMVSSSDVSCKVKPASNNPAYGQIVVTVRDNYSGKEYEGYGYASFAKVMVYGITVSPTAINFDSNQASPVSISATYKGVTSVSSPNIKDCFYVSSDENVATVSSNGSVTPVGRGNCTITTYAYDGGFSARTTVTVNGNPNVTGKIVMKASPNSDNGTVPVEGATITIGSKTATSSSDGTFTINDVELGATATITYKTGVTRTVKVESENIGNIPIVICDMNKDGFVNAKDYVYIIKSGNDQNLLNQFNEFYNVKVTY